MSGLWPSREGKMGQTIRPALGNSSQGSWHAAWLSDEGNVSVLELPREASGGGEESDCQGSPARGAEGLRGLSKWRSLGSRPPGGLHAYYQGVHVLLSRNRTFRLQGVRGRHHFSFQSLSLGLSEEITRLSWAFFFFFGAFKGSILSRYQSQKGCF